MSALLIFGLLFGLMLTGMPISISLGLTVLAFLFTMTQVPIESVIGDLAAETSESQPDGRLDRQDVIRLLDHLKPRQRDIVRSISIDGHSIQDVARRLDMSEVAVRVALHRAIKLLAALYREGAP